MYRLGLDIGGTKTAIAIVDEQENLRHRAKLPSTQALQAVATPVGSLAASIRDFCWQNGVELTAVEGVGIGVPAVMDRLSQTIPSCPNLPILDGVPLGPNLTEELDVPVFVENDVNLIALGEHVKGRGIGISDLACVYVGSGIGCALILEGRLYPGADGAAGEFGHTVIEPEGRQCTCGGQGCLEMYCSGKALALQAASILRQDEGENDPVAVSWAEAELVIGAAKAGQPVALEAVRTAFHYLGLGITNLANILNPRLVILGGGIVTGWPAGIDIVRETVQTRTRMVVRDRLVIDRPVLGEKAGLLGAAILVKNNLVSKK